MKENIVITISPEHIDEMKNISQKLKEVKITNVFDFGVITGVTEEENIQKLKQITEIEDITIEKQINLPPNDRGIQ